MYTLESRAFIKLFSLYRVEQLVLLRRSLVLCSGALVSYLYFSNSLERIHFDLCK